VLVSVLMNLADELLVAAVDRELPRLNEQLHFDAIAQPEKTRGNERKR
jgi:hypothetical protein